MFCKKVNRAIKVIAKKFDTLAEQAVSEALEVTTSIKDFIGSGNIDLLLQSLNVRKPEILIAIQEGLDVAIDQLGALNSCGQKETATKRLLCYVAYIKTLTATDRNAKLIKTASIIAAKIDMDRYQEHEYDAFVQSVYTAGKLSA